MEKFNNLVEEFADLDNFDRYQNILDYANISPELPKDYCISKNLIPGCASNLWVGLHDNIIKSQADAVITKGLAGMFCNLFNNLSITEATNFNSNLLDQLGLILSPSRANGMLNLIKKLKELSNDRYNTRTN